MSLPHMLILEQIKFQLSELDTKTVSLSASNIPEESIILARLFELNKHAINLDNIRRSIFTDHIKSVKEKESEKELLKELDAIVAELKFECELSLENQFNTEQELKERETQRVAAAISKSQNKEEKDGKEDIEVIVEQESIDVLRRRLLSTNKPSQLDTIKSIEQDNAYHESMQEEYISDITSFVSQLKDSAMSFQESLFNDKGLLDAAQKEIEKSSGGLSFVSSSLKAYHKSGRLGFFFYIKLIAGLLIAFILMLVLIKLF